MKICHYDSRRAGAVVGDQVYPIGDALTEAGHLRVGYTMRDVIDVLANQPAAMACVRDAQRAGSPAPLSAVTLLAPILDAPSLWAAAADYRDHQAVMGLHSRSPGGRKG